MSLFRLSQAAQWLSARQEGGDLDIQSVGSDSRRMEPGQLFVALTGPHFDGHAFAPQAVAGGALALLVSRELPLAVPQLVVPDTREALGRLAAAWRRQLSAQVVAVTGSNGKTTTKEMLAALLGQAGRVAATQGNLNNDIGLPLTLLRARDQDFLILEMGANHPGEIAYLTDIARPDLALITNAGRAHLEGFGSLEGVVRAKGEILGGLAPDGWFVLNQDDAGAAHWRELAGGRRLMSFGLGPGADVSARPGPDQPRPDGTGFEGRHRISTPRGQFDLTLALPGRHNLMNALACIAVGEALGLSHQAMADGLARVRPVAGRLQWRPARSGAGLIDDSYNANPDSLGAALQVLGGLSGRRWLVLGDLAELGPGAVDLHRQLGQGARDAGLDRLWAVGPLSRAAVAAFGPGGEHFEAQGDLIQSLESALTADDWVLVKGSRSSAMDRVVRALVVEGD